MIGTTISHYKILEKVGEGGMGVVYKAMDLDLNRAVALKFLSPNASLDDAQKSRFRREAQAAATLNHPNICTIYGIEEHEGNQFIVMELIDGGTLRNDQNWNQPIEGSVDAKLKAALLYALQMSDALQEAHSAGIVHRDFKPDNVMVKTNGQVKVMDFGVAKLKGSLKLTRTLNTVGTIAYMAPEQIQGGDVDHRADIFAFGVVLYEMLSNRLPFRGDHEAAAMYSILHENPRALSAELPDEVKRIIARLLEKNPSDRYQSMKDVMADLKAVQSRYLSAQQTTDWRRFARRRFSSSLAIVIGSIIALLLAIILVYRIYNSAESNYLNPDIKISRLNLPFNQVFSPALSRDGNWVAFGALPRAGIYFMNIREAHARSVAENLFVSPFDRIDISPGGESIVYRAFEKDGATSAVYVISALGGIPRKIAVGASMLRWHPDGSSITFQLGSKDSPSASGYTEFWSSSPDGSLRTLLFVDSVSTSRGEQRYDWSQDGESMVFVREYAEAEHVIVVRNVSKGAEREIFRERTRIRDVCWSPTGHILFSSNRKGNMNVWSIAVNGGEPIQVTKGVGFDSAIRVSGDGSKVLYLEEQMAGTVWSQLLDDGSLRKQETFEEAFIDRPAVSPDGALLAFGKMLSQTESTGSLFIMDRATGNQRQLTSGRGFPDETRWSPSGSYLAYSLLGRHKDSSRVMIMDMKRDFPPRFVSYGRDLWWASGTKLVFFREMKTWIIDVESGTEQQFFRDSTLALPISNMNYILFHDFRTSQGDWWVVKAEGNNAKKGEKPRKLVTTDQMITVSPKGSFLLCMTTEGTQKVELPSGKSSRSRVQMSFVNGVGINTANIRYDGKEVVSADVEMKGKLVLLESVFRTKD